MILKESKKWQGYFESMFRGLPAIIEWFLCSANPAQNLFVCLLKNPFCSILFFHPSPQRVESHWFESCFEDEDSITENQREMPGQLRLRRKLLPRREIGQLSILLIESDSLEVLFHQSFVGLYLWKDQEFKIVEEVWPPSFSQA